MYKDKKILAVILARGGSKRIPKKNIKLLAGKPLIAHSILETKKSELIDKIIVSSDDKEILNIANEYGAETQIRPAELAQDNTYSNITVKYVHEQAEKQDNTIYNIVLLIQPTTPFRKHSIIDECISTLIDNNLDSVNTIKKVDEHPSLMYTIEDNKSVYNDKESFFDRSKRKQFYILNGAVYAFTRETIQKGIFYGEKHQVKIMNKEESLDIDTPDDWILAEKRFETKENLTIDNKQIGPDQPTFIIAEAGVNHNGDIELAKKLIDAAYESKADAVKFQTFNADAGTSKLAQKVDYQKNNTQDNENYHDMLKKLELTQDQFQELKDYTESKKLIFMSTASDFESLKILNNINVSSFKIGSGHITNIPLIKEMAKSQKPILLSIGMSTYDEIREAVDAILAQGNSNIALLHCVSNYPTEAKDVNLKAIQELQKIFPQFNIGYSDHTLNSDAAVASIPLNAKIIEKHLTLDKNMQGPDHKASITPSEFKELVEKIRKTELMLGDGIKKITETEKLLSKQVRRSIIANKTIQKGTTITKEMLAIKKPSTGIQPKHYENIIGKISNKDISEDTPIQWEDLQ